MIENVNLVRFKVLEDERGKLFEIIRSDSVLFKNFGQAYIATCKPGWVKGWHYHKIQTDYFILVKGSARIVLVSEDKKDFEVYDLHSDEPSMLIIPPKVIHGFECISKEESWILNIPTELYDYKKPDEYRLKLDDPSLPYDPWKVRKGW